MIYAHAPSFARGAEVTTEKKELPIKELDNVGVWIDSGYLLMPVGNFLGIWPMSTSLDGLDTLPFLTHPKVTTNIGRKRTWNSRRRGPVVNHCPTDNGSNWRLQSRHLLVVSKTNNGWFRFLLEVISSKLNNSVMKWHRTFDHGRLT